MNNQEASRSIEDCSSELENISNLIESLGHTSRPVPFITKYALMKACGTIEFCFKTIIADVHTNQSPQIQNYINRTIRESSMNPNKNNICKTLNQFDPIWNTNFKDRLNNLPDKERINASLESLNTARNTFAHGGQITQSFDQIRGYFNDAVIIINLIDEVVNHSENVVSTAEVEQPEANN